MEIFREIIVAVQIVPDWVPLILYPAALIVFTVLVLTLGGRQAYPYVAAAFGAVAFAMLCCKAEITEAFVFLGVYAALAFALKLFFLIPPPKKRKKGERRNRDEELYRKFGKPVAPPPKSPPMVCKFEEETIPFEESGARLTHAETLLARLKASQLSPSDRLEAEVIARSLDSYRGKPLTPAELRSLNDCLASILKLTAKYKL